MGHRSMTFPSQCQALPHLLLLVRSHSMTSGQEKRRYFPALRTGNGGPPNRPLARDDSYTQLNLTWRRLASCAGVKMSSAFRVPMFAALICTNHAPLFCNPHFYWLRSWSAVTTTASQHPF